MEFKEITKDNWQECIALWTDEDQYIASNVYSIAEAQFYPKAHSKGIYVDNVMIGYTMYGEDEEDSDLFFIDRFMIGKEFRRRGFGVAAILNIVAIGREKGFPKIETSTDRNNKNMQAMLAKAGFRTVGEIRDDEVVYFIK